MNAGRGEGLTVHLTPDDPRSTHSAGVTYARALAGACTSDFLDALAEQEGLIVRWVIHAGFSARQARTTGREFKTAARAEWDRIAAAGGGVRGGRA